ncbi:hypothetical protein AWENTII_008592 [Aspergillus wentii]
MESDGSSVVPAPMGKRRIPKACSSCRQSKVKCDGSRPCTRCNKLKRQCVFFEAPKDPTVERLENVESEVRLLREQLDDIRQLLLHRPQSTMDEATFQTQQHQTYSASAYTSSPSQVGSNPTTVPTIVAAVPSTSPSGFQFREPGISSNDEIPVDTPFQTKNAETVRLAKRKRSGFEIRDEPISDFINTGLITMENAMVCFRT